MNVRTVIPSLNQNKETVVFTAVMAAFPVLLSRKVIKIHVVVDSLDNNSWNNLLEKWKPKIFL
jgi:hypothetical protein